eukprot:6181839-Pleurochrysis_carterae.AAC.1
MQLCSIPLLSSPKVACNQRQRKQDVDMYVHMGCQFKEQKVSFDTFSETDQIDGMHGLINSNVLGKVKHIESRGIFSSTAVNACGRPSSTASGERAVDVSLLRSSPAELPRKRVLLVRHVVGDPLLPPLLGAALELAPSQLAARHALQHGCGGETRLGLVCAAAHAAAHAPARAAVAAAPHDRAPGAVLLI